MSTNAWRAVRRTSKRSFFQLLISWLATLRRDFVQRVLPITADIADA